MECNWTRQQVYKCALKTSKVLNYTPKCDITSIFYNLGGRFNNSKTDYFTVTRRELFFLNERWRYDRFQIAKAIGHYLLHSKLGTPITIPNGQLGRIEIEGNWFAIRFLLPEPEFSDRLKEWNSIARLSVYFDVPECVVKQVIVR